MDISGKNMLAKVTVPVIYIYMTAKDKDKKIIGVYYWNKSINNNEYKTKEDLYDMLFANEIIAWSGKYNKETDTFMNVSMVYPCKNSDGTKYLKTAEDTTESNNLEKLPDYQPKK